MLINKFQLQFLYLCFLTPNKSHPDYVYKNKLRSMYESFSVSAFM